MWPLSPARAGLPRRSLPAYVRRCRSDGASVDVERVRPIPPSTPIVGAVTKRAASEARTRPRPRRLRRPPSSQRRLRLDLFDRCRGIALVVVQRSVSMTPGAIELKRTPGGPYSIGQRARHRVDGAFRRRVGRALRRSDHAGDRRQIDDRSSPRSTIDGNTARLLSRSRLRTFTVSMLRRALNPPAPPSAPARPRLRCSRARRRAGAPPVRSVAIVDGASSLRQVGPDHHRFVGELTGDRLEPFDAPSDERHARTGAVERASSRGTDASARARHERRSTR